MIRIAAAPALALLLAGCSTDGGARPEPQIITIEKPVPVASPCVPANLKGAPAYPDTDEALRAAAGPAERYQLVGAGRPLRIARLNELETVVAGCPRKKADQ